MSASNNTIQQAIEKLSDISCYQAVCHQKHKGIPMPSLDALSEIVTLVRGIIFPGYFGNVSINNSSLKSHITDSVDRLNYLLAEQILAGLCFDNEITDTAICLEKASTITEQFIGRLPIIRDMLVSDVIAEFNGDPSAKNYGEIIFCYPSIRAISNFRMAHELLLLKVPLIPRIITEMAHSETGIDIHPGATIGDSFAIDHGTGIVIGETAIIGKNVQLYQGVTLGAKSFPLDSEGNPIKGIPRHPILEDNVIVYSNASILGRITIGKGSVIGGNVWVVSDLPAGSKIIQK